MFLPKPLSLPLISTVLCSYNGQDDGRVGLYVAAEPLTKDKNYFEVEIIDIGVVGTVGECLCRSFII